MELFEKFLKKVVEDKELQEKFKEILVNKEITDKTAATVKLAEEYGIGLKAEDIKAFVEAAKDENGNELTDAQLDMVAGGGFWDDLFIALGINQPFITLFI